MSEIVKLTAANGTPEGKTVWVNLDKVEYMERSPLDDVTYLVPLTFQCNGKDGNLTIDELCVYETPEEIVMQSYFLPWGNQEDRKEDEV